MKPGFSSSVALSAGLIVGAMVIGARPMTAECVTGLEEPMICGALNAADAVFLADVEDVRFPPGGFRTEVRFRIVEAFKGVKAGVQTLQFVETAEGYGFRSGLRVLVYARSYQGAWTTQCSRTRPADGLSGELETLRALVKGVPGGLVDGHVVSADGSNNYPGLRVTLRAQSGQRIVQAVATNGAGHFTFEWLSPGAYTLVIDGGPSFLSEQRSVVVERKTCLTVPTVVLRSRRRT